MSGPRYVECWRCGQTMRKPIDMHLTEDAPCRDCREVLELEGIPLERWTTRERQAA